MKKPKPIEQRRCDFALAVVKGLVEKQRSAAYFGSTLALDSWITVAATQGWVKVVEGAEPTLTDLGRAAYELEKLDKLPHEGRAYMWDWSAL